MSVNAFLGIDGGGTKTAFLLDVDGEKFESIQKTIHPMQVTKEEFIQRLNNGIDEVLNKANLDVSEITYSFVAIPGFGQYPETEEFVLEKIEDSLKSKNFEVGNDCLNAWAGSLNAEEGINLILGTGSIGYGMDSKGQSAICGGWGPILGDEASGYYIGSKILNVFTKMSDGRIKKTLLYNLIKEDLSIENDIEIISLAAKMKRDEIASVSKVLTKALEENDPIALEIVDDVAKEAALVIDAIIEKLSFGPHIKVSYSGGVYNVGDILINKIKEYVDKDIEMVKPIYSPVEGSVILAKIGFKNNK